VPINDQTFLLQHQNWQWKDINRYILTFHDKDRSDSLDARTWLTLYPGIDIDIMLGYWWHRLIQLRKREEPVVTLQPDTRYILILILILILIHIHILILILILSLPDSTESRKLETRMKSCRMKNIPEDPPDAKLRRQFGQSSRTMRMCHCE
jgi:hypothetical protein